MSDRLQRSLFPSGVQPLVVSYGMGVDSTALLVGLARRRIRPDLILFADTGGEKDETYAYREVMDAFLKEHGFPTVTVVRYVPTDFKHWPPYYTLEQNCLTNGTLPSLAFGSGSCSQKWKAAPQNGFVANWLPAIECWAAGGHVRKAIGFDCSPADIRRRHHAAALEDERYDYWYPLQEWKWDRAECERQIRTAGLPVPPKSSCFFCPAMKPCEVDALPREKLRRIVIMEARAKPRLKKIQGLWGNGCKGTRGAVARPGTMTEYIRQRDLLDPVEIVRLCSEVPVDLIDRNQQFASGRSVQSWDEFFAELAGAEGVVPAAAQAATQHKDSA